MKRTVQDCWGDSRIPAAQWAWPLVQDPQIRPDRTEVEVKRSEYEQVTCEELFEGLTEFRMVRPDSERRCSFLLGSDRAARLRELLLRVWETDRMI